GEGAETDTLVAEIIGRFNQDERCKEIGLSARPFRSKHMTARFADYLPDIIFDMPDELFWEGKGPFLSRNDNYGPINTDLASVQSDMHSGQKGRHPLFCTDSATAALIADDICTDLRLVYRAVNAVLNNSKRL